MEIIRCDVKLALVDKSADTYNFPLVLSRLDQSKLLFLPDSIKIVLKKLHVPPFKAFSGHGQSLGGYSSLPLIVSYQRFQKWFIKTCPTKFIMTKSKAFFV